MRATQTQIDAFHGMTSKQLGAKQQMIVDLFTGPHLTLTRQEIAERTNLSLSCVCGRVFELIEAEILKVRGSQKCVATGTRREKVGLVAEVSA